MKIDYVPAWEAPIEAIECAPTESMRPVFDASKFWFVKPNEPYLCNNCGVDHEYYTHGCVPVAFHEYLLSGFRNHPNFTVVPATKEGVPYSIHSICPIPGGPECPPHKHEDFRWL